MDYTKKTILVTMLFFAFFSGVCLAKPAAKSKQSGIKAMELLDKFAETMDKAHTSFVTKSKSKVFTDTNYHSEDLAYMNGKHTRYFLEELRSDGERIKQIQEGWGDLEGLGEYIFVPESKRYYACRTNDGKNRYRHSRDHDKLGYVVIKSKGSEKDITFDIDMIKGSRNLISSCFGYLEGDYMRFDRILKKAGPRRVTVRDKMEQVNGTDCYVIDAKTNRGEYTIWLNPEKGYNYSKATVVRQAGNLFKLEHKLDTDSMVKYSIEITQFAKVDGVWVPVRARGKSDRTFPNYDGNAVIDLELTSILIDPDHNGLDSFSVDDIPENAEVASYVNVKGVSNPVAGPQYRWSKNPKFVADRQGRRVRYEPDKGMLPVVKRIPNPRTFNRELSFEKVKDKKVLLCFCKLDLRSSQEYVLKLTEHADSLAQKDVAVILVQVPAIDPRRRSEWMEKNEVTFPVGKVYGKKAKYILRSWGTDKLPHLVLADKDHVVIFEGFKIEELNEKIREIDHAAH